MKIELITVPKYSSDNFTLIYSGVDGSKSIHHIDGPRARVTNCTNDQLKEIHELMTFARKHRKHQLNTTHNDESHN